VRTERKTVEELVMERAIIIEDLKVMENNYFASR